MLLWSGGTPATAAELKAPEYQVKAAFLYNFTKLTEWPTNAFTQTNSPLVVGVLGKDPFGVELDQALAGKVVSGRPLTARRVVSDDQIAGCHLLFISGSERSRLSELLTKLSSLPVLSVSDIDRFAARGGMVGLVPQGEELRLEVNPNAAGKAGLKLSSRLLRLARIVRSEPQRTP